MLSPHPGGSRQGEKITKKSYLLSIYNHIYNRYLFFQVFEEAVKVILFPQKEEEVTEKKGKKDKKEKKEKGEKEKDCSIQ